MSNALNIIPCKTASCPEMDIVASRNKRTVAWGNHKMGDIILFDFNRNGKADHTGIVLARAGSMIYTIEGNTGNGSNTNGGAVQIRPRTKSTIKRFVRPKYTKDITPAMVVYTALGEVGTTEYPKNSNKVKYNRWFYGKNISAYWCMTFVCWDFGNVQKIPKVAKPKTRYTGAIGTAKAGSKGEGVKNVQRFLNWYYPKFKLVVDGECGAKTMRATMVYQNTEGLAVDADFGAKSRARANTYKGTAKTTAKTSKTTTTKPATTTKKTTTTKPATTTAPAKPAPKITAKVVGKRIEVDLTNQICTVYERYSDGTKKAIMSEFVSTARKGKTTPVGNWKIQGTKNLKAKYRTAKLSGGKSYAEYLVRFKGAKCMHCVPYSKRNTKGLVNKNEFNKLGTPRSAGCVRMPNKMAKYIYNNCPVGTPVIVFKGKAGEYPMGKPKKYTANTNHDPTA